MIFQRLFVFLLLASSAWAQIQNEPPRLVVAILVDQLRYDYLERFSEQFTANGFRLFSERGAFLTFARYNYCPTVTGPGHASFLSGATPAMHGIIANDWLDRKTGLAVYCCDDPTAKGVGTTATNANQMSPRNFIGAGFADQLRLHHRSKVISVAMKDRGAILPAGKKPAGAFWFEAESGHFTTSSYYMKELPGWVRTFNRRQQKSDFAGKTWDRLLDPSNYLYPDAAAGEGTLAGETNSTFPHKIHIGRKDGFEAILPTPYGNQLLAEFAEAAIEGEKLGEGPQPDLLCISFSGVDAVGHRFGPYSQEVQDVVLRLDRQLAEFFRYLDRRIGLNRVTMILTADHGVSPNPEFAVEQGLDGQRLNEGTFMLDLMGQLDAKFGAGKYFLAPRMYGGNLYFNHATLQEKKLAPAEVASFIRDWALSTGKVHACYSREQLLEGRAPGPIGKLVLNGYNGERGGDLIIIPKPYIMPGTGASGTTHGSPFMPDTHVPVMFFGSAFKPGRYADEFYITDIAPTLCTALHIDMPPGCMGKPFVKILGNP